MEQRVIIESNGAVIFEGPVSAVLERDSKKIKLSGEKLANIFSKRLKKEEKMEIEEPVIDDVSSVIYEEESKFDRVVNPMEMSRLINEIEAPQHVIEESVVEEKEEVKEEVALEPKVVEQPRAYSNYRGLSTSMPDIKSANNTINVDTKIEKLKKEAEQVDRSTIIGQVLVAGVSKIEQVEKEIVDLEKRNGKISEIIERLMTEKNLAQRDNKALENEMGKTMRIDISKIQDAIALEAARDINEKLEIISERKNVSDSNIGEIEEKISGHRKEKEELLDAKKGKESELYEICREIEDNKVKANELMKRSSELQSLREKHEREELTLEEGIEQLRSKISLIEEKPKKVMNISNPFDRVRQMEEQVEEEMAISRR